MFRGYKYKFDLYAAHSNFGVDNTNVHYHNFSVVLYIDQMTSAPDEDFKIEKAVTDWLQPFQNASLADTELFRGKETIIEGIGNAFFEGLYYIVEQYDYELIRLDIFENPIRVYTVSRNILDSTVNRINGIDLQGEILINIDEAPDENELLSEVAVSKECETVVLKESEEICKVFAESDELIELKSDKAVYKSGSNIVIKRIFRGVGLIVGLAILCAVAVLTMLIIKQSGRYPQGSDTLCHLYRGEYLLNSIKQGVWYPLYDSSWYNGVEIMRYWGPAPLYLIALLEYLIQGTVLDAYILYLGVLVVIGGCGWMLFGIRYHRMALATLMGLIWFYFPENMRVVIYEGNLPRGLINALLPFFFFFLIGVIQDKRKSAMWQLIIVTALITLCHLGITLMLAASIVIFLCVYAKLNKNIRWCVYAVGAMMSGILITGLWCVPALIGGAASGSATNQVMVNFFESALVSLNVINRFSGDLLSFYFGISVFIICILGIIFADKKVKPGFITAIIIYLCTTQSIYALFVQLPFSQYLWMIRFIPIALALAVTSLLMWRNLRKWLIVLLSVLLIVDCAYSVNYIIYPKEQWVQDVEQNMEQRAEELLLTKAKDITKQRMAVLDLSTYGSFAPYYISGVGKHVNYTFGAGWEGANTADNIVNLNAATEYGWYTYLFDRALEMGNDTVLVPVSQLKNEDKDAQKLIESAAISGYTVVDNNASSILFHIETPEQFGTITTYDNLAIGQYANVITMVFPSFGVVSSNNLNEYTYEELCNYKTIYLTGFTYDNKESAEQLLLRLSQSGVKIFVDMDSIPQTKTQKVSEFLGVNAQTISIDQAYPSLVYEGTTYTSLSFSSDMGQWNTVYLDGLDNTTGYGSEVGRDIPFCGTVDNENLYFMGMNLVYYLEITGDAEIRNMLTSMMGISVSDIPHRYIVPVTVSTEPNRITILSQYDNVNIALASIDIFTSNDEYRIEDNLIKVSSGTTVIDINYPHIDKGIIATILGFTIGVITWIAIVRRRKDEDK